MMPTQLSMTHSKAQSVKQCNAIVCIVQLPALGQKRDFSHIQFLHCYSTYNVSARGESKKKASFKDASDITPPFEWPAKHKPNTNSTCHQLRTSHTVQETRPERFVCSTSHAIFASFSTKVCTRVPAYMTEDRMPVLFYYTFVHRFSRVPEKKRAVILPRAFSQKHVCKLSWKNSQNRVRN